MQFVDSLLGLLKVDRKTAETFKTATEGAAKGGNPAEALKDIEGVVPGENAEDTVEKTANSSKVKEAIQGLRNKIMKDKSLKELWDTAKANMSKWYAKILAFLKKHLSPTIVKIAVAVLLLGTVLCLYALKKKKGEKETTESICNEMAAFTEASQEEMEMEKKLLPWAILSMLIGVVAFFMSHPIVGIFAIAFGIAILWVGPKVAIKAIKYVKGGKGAEKAAAEAKPDYREFTEEDIRHYDNEFKKFYKQSIGQHIDLDYESELSIPEDIGQKLKAKFPWSGKIYEPEEIPIKSVGRKKWFEKKIREHGYKPYHDDPNMLCAQLMDILNTKAHRAALEILKPYTAKDKMKRWKELYDNEPYRTYEKL